MSSAPPPPASISIPPLPEWRRILRPGQRLFLASGAACPLALMESMLEAANSVDDLELVQGLTLGPSPWTDKRYTPNLHINAFFLDPRVSERVNAGMDDYTPAHYSDLPALFADRVVRIDVALIMVSPPDAWGYCSLGPTVQLTPAACAAAHTVIAQINPAMPRSHGLSDIHVSKINYAIVAEAPLPELPAPEIDEAALKIGAYAAQLVNDGDTLQCGVGAVGNAFLRALAAHRNLGLHTEVFGDGVMALFEAGVIDNSRKSLLPGKLVAATGLGSAAFYRFIDNNPHIDLRPTEFINSPLSIARNRRMVAVNSALQVDLTGQVVVDSVSGLFRSGIGSQADFVRGAAMSEGGRPIIALPSTGTDADGRRVSRITADLPAGAGVGINRADVHYIVTEHGIATLRGRTVQERVQELIQVAHPDFREDLLRQARAHNFVPAWFQLPPPYADEAHGIQARRIRLADGNHYILRPLNPADDRRLQEFFYSHTEETINRRYGFTIKRMSRKRAFELVGVDQNRDLALAVFEMQGPRQVIHAVGRYYLDPGGKSAEMAFVVSEQKRRIGMANTLLTHMLQIAHNRGLDVLWAQMDRDNAPMLQVFRHFNVHERAGDEGNTLVVEIPVAKAACADKPRSQKTNTK